MVYLVDKNKGCLILKFLFFEILFLMVYKYFKFYFVCNFLIVVGMVIGFFVVIFFFGLGNGV